MEIRKIKDEDLDEIDSWYRARGLNPLDHALLPKNGFIVPGVCALFLYVTDGAIGFLEGLISNPKELRVVRAQGIMGVVEISLGEARNLGIKKLYFLSTEDSVAGYGSRFGFDLVKKYNLFQKEL